MVRGFYSAAAGVLSRQKAMDVISNNIANAATAGYKSQATAEMSFGAHLVSRLSASPANSQVNIGPGAFMTVNTGTYSDFTQGMLESTGRNVDMAIQGEGFFLVESERYGEVLTRNGQFEIDEDGDLALPGVGKVLNDRGREINIEESNFSVGADGTLYVDGREEDTLYIAVAEEDSRMTVVGPGVYVSEGGYRRADEESFRIIQGYIEKANVNMAKEMSNIIAGQNHFQSCAQVLKIYDRINELSVNRVGSIE
ncbi:MAG: flagellar hook basal-body protein [Bacillota bacterium]|jgi:flagellar basal-body rod protein FlgF|nr:flagellar hook basal-body protein [Bacillota bacterium]NLM08362.1 flagellar hook basal-body protein [Clostridiales Family XIII bacterium]